MSFELPIGKYLFAPKLIPTLLALIMLPILVSLGLWQLDRAEEKRIIDKGVTDAIATPAFSLNNANLADIENNIYRAASLYGQYDNKQQFLLDNRIHNGQPGYHVISPFLFEHSAKLSSTTKLTKYGVLINRGWIGYNGTRDQIADISLENEILEIEGAIKTIPRSIVLKEKADDDSSTDLVFKMDNKQLEGVSLIQSIQLDRLEKALSYELLPVMIELDRSSKDGFIRDWQPYYGSIDKHNAYALQWFAMASILLFLFIKLNIRKR